MTHVFVVGIGGAGLSAITTVLLQQGYTVSGSDMLASPVTQRLARLGAAVFIGHRPENLAAAGGTIEAVIVSSAVAPDNPELAEARRRGLPIFKRAQWLGRMMEHRAGIAVAGSHGKTTTTAMTALLLREAGQDPTFIVGGFIPQLDTNAAAGQGDAFVIEADEYDYMFLGLQPQIAVVTTVEWDHPDIFPTPAVFQQAFIDFVRLVPAGGLVIGCGDDPGARAVIRQAQTRVVTYGLDSGNDWQAVNLRLNEQGGFDFEVVSTWPAGTGEIRSSVSLSVPGVHNVRNALAALIIGYECGIAPPLAAEILSRYEGVGRRFELKGEANGVTVIDDYAHHPTEIRTTLAAARARFGPRSMWVLFQPHTFSRVLALLPDFAGAFGEADHVIIVDIFASRESDQGLVHSRDILDQMTHPDGRYIGSLAEATDYLVDHLAGPAVLLTLGAGDGYLAGEWVLERLRKEGKNDG